MASPAPLIAPREGIGAALKKLLGDDLIEHVFAVGEDSVTVRRDASAGVMTSFRYTLGYQHLMECAGVDYPDSPESFEFVHLLLTRSDDRRVGTALSCRCVFLWL